MFTSGNKNFEKISTFDYIPKTGFRQIPIFPGFGGIFRKSISEMLSKFEIFPNFLFPLSNILKTHLLTILYGPTHYDQPAL